MIWNKSKDGIKKTWDRIDETNNNPIVEDMPNVPVERYSNDVVEHMSFFIKGEEITSTWKEVV